MEYAYNNVIEKPERKKHLEELVGRCKCNVISGL
jgi:hypothetical protein